MNNPFLLRPSAKDYLWGGRRLNDEFAKNIDISPLAETWECSTHPDGPSFAASGEFSGQTLGEILDSHPEYLGKNAGESKEFPILIKFIDANKDLSVQVHPSDEYAKEHENGQRGKTEMWYVLDASRDAKLIYGMRRDLDKEELQSAYEQGRLGELLQRGMQKVPVQKDDLFLIEAGTVHAIGAGTLVAEIQENSNLTYRLYDYDRVDKNGKKRELHIKKALDVANLKRMPEPRQPLRVLKYRYGVAEECLVNCRYFQVNRMIVNTERRQIVKYRADELSFRVLLCIHGCGSISYGETPDHLPQTLNVYKGDCIFVPADSVELTLHGQMSFLDVRV